MNRQLYKHVNNRQCVPKIDWTLIGHVSHKQGRFGHEKTGTACRSRRKELRAAKSKIQLALRVAFRTNQHQSVKINQGNIQTFWEDSRRHTLGQLTGLIVLFYQLMWKREIIRLTSLSLVALLFGVLKPRSSNKVYLLTYSHARDLAFSLILFAF